MPVNFQQAVQQIREMGSHAAQQSERRRKLRDEAIGLLTVYAEDLDTLEQLVERAAAENSSLRCALPFGETLDASIPAPVLASAYTLLAADGSQINPDRHSAVHFGAINVGAISMLPGRGEAPSEVVRSRLLFQDNLVTASGRPLTEELVALMRDLSERQVLAELARHAAPPVVALTDGPLELFREPKGMPEFEEELRRYQAVLEDLAELDVATAGYVDRPQSDLVVRLLELILLSRAQQLHKAGQNHPLQGVTDLDLFFDLLRPGQRSALFGIHSGSAKSFQGRLAPYFFYLNVGRDDEPYLARVEVPRWVAESPVLYGQLHACLVAQVRPLASRPYPYVLHRAHEIAVISMDEKQQLEMMIALEMRRHGIAVGRQSNKQNAKQGSTSPTRSR